LNALRREARQYTGMSVDTVYFGGGTPALLDERQLETLFKIVSENFHLNENCEMTVEANPEGLDALKAKRLKLLGVSRISLGIQSLNDRYLKYLGRCHDSRLALHAFDYLRSAGFNNINLDLMYSFPGQSTAEIKKDVEEIIDLGSEHLSLYALTIEPNSKFYVRDVKLDDDHRRADDYAMIVDLLQNPSAGFRQYEVSNFAKPGYESRHNLSYWQGKNYIGLGIGAHSHIDGRRFWNTPRLQEYLLKMPQGMDIVEDREELSASQRLMEAVLIGLRMNRGVNLREMEERFGCGILPQKYETIISFVKEGFLNREGDILSVTQKGRLVLEELSARLI